MFPFVNVVESNKFSDLIHHRGRLYPRVETNGIMLAVGEPDICCHGNSTWQERNQRQVIRIINIVKIVERVRFG